MSRLLGYDADGWPLSVEDPEHDRLVEEQMAEIERGETLDETAVDILLRVQDEQASRETLDVLIERCVAAGWRVRFEEDLGGIEAQLFKCSSNVTIYGCGDVGDTPLAALNAAIEAAAAAGHTIGEGEA